MTKDVNHIENQPELNREIQEMISGSSIAWGKTKEEIWPEILGKMEEKSPVVRTRKTIYLQVAKYAAAAVIALILGIPAAMYFYTKTVKNPLSQNTEVLLPDNSKVTVYAQSVLSYKPLLWKITRTVKLEGEALFEVQKGKKFEVVSRKGKTVVLGTQFTVYSRHNDYKVTCTSGKVKVIEAAHQNEAVLTADQKAILKPDGTFEIEDLNNTRPETSNKVQNKMVDDVLNDVYSATPAEMQPTNKESQKSQVNKPSAENEKAAVKEPAKTEEQNTPEGQNKQQAQNNEGAQNKEQSKTSAQTQAGNKEPGQTQNQENAKGQNTDNQQKQDKFRTSLTPKQLSILDNKQMSREEKRKALIESLSDEQRKLLKEQNEERAKQNNMNASGEGDDMKEQQKAQTREQNRQNTGTGSQEQQMRQNQENKENAKSGSGSSSGNQPGKGN